LPEVTPINGRRDLGALEHRADPKGRVSDPEGHVSEKWTRFSAKNDTLIQEESIGPTSANPLLGLML
jgi:hypothetical protein